MTLYIGYTARGSRVECEAADMDAAWELLSEKAYCIGEYLTQVEEA